MGAGVPASSRSESRLGGACADSGGSVRRRLRPCLPQRLRASRGPARLHRAYPPSGLAGRGGAHSGSGPRGIAGGGAARHRPPSGSSAGRPRPRYGACAGRASADATGSRPASQPRPHRRHDPGTREPAPAGPGVDDPGAAALLRAAATLGRAGEPGFPADRAHAVRHAEQSGCGGGGGLHRRASSPTR